MKTPHEISELSIDDLLRELQCVLPAHWKFEWEDDYAPIRARLIDMKTEECVWLEPGVDLRLLLLSAYGWIWLQKHPASSNRWHIHEDRDSRKAYDRLPSDSDPPDLDPSEVQTVYTSQS